MKIILYGVAILLMGTDSSVIEDTKTIKTVKEQRILLRKLQNFPAPKDEAKPLTWNEILADVLVNRIKIFSFNNVDKEQEVINTETVAKDSNSFLTKCISQVLLIYKKFVYDKFLTTPTNPKVVNNKNMNDQVPIKDAENENESEIILTGVSINSNTNNSGLNAVKGPKSEVELVEPKYHGKQVNVDSEEVTTEDPSTEGNVQKDCMQGLVKSENGDCVEISKLVLAIPSQCPQGYKRDRLGFCRMRF